MLIAITSAWAKKEPALEAGLETFCGADTCYASVIRVALSSGRLALSDTLRQDWVRARSSGFHRSTRPRLYHCDDYSACYAHHPRLHDRVPISGRDEVICVKVRHGGSPLTGSGGTPYARRPEQSERPRARRLRLDFIRSRDVLDQHFPDVVALAVQHRLAGIDGHPDHGFR